jgi:hypoxanthine phosphoribosyltransferase
VTRFANETERDYTVLFDRLGLAWEYEPRTFPLDVDPDGRVRSAFTPDFYLPDLDLYIEVTVANQSYLTRKNGKLRRFRELYPDTRVILLVRRDYEALGLGSIASSAANPSGRQLKP